MNKAPSMFLNDVNEAQQGHSRKSYCRSTFQMFHLIPPDGALRASALAFAMTRLNHPSILLTLTPNSPDQISFVVSLCYNSIDECGANSSWSELTTICIPGPIEMICEFCFTRFHPNIALDRKLFRE
jgi:hypothetical protein